MTDCKHLSGYWINEGTSFRCYACGCQFFVRELAPDPARNIEVWEPGAPSEPPDEDGGDFCTRCGDPIDHNEPCTECSSCRRGTGMP